MYFEIGTVAENLLIVKALCDLYGKKIKCTLAMLVYLTIIITDMCLIEYDLLPKWTCLFGYLAMIGYCISSFKPKFKVLIINLVLSALILSGLQVFSGFLLYLFLGSPVDDKREICVVHLFTLLIYLLLTKFVNMEKIARFFQKGYVLLNAALGGGFTVLVVLMVRSKITEKYEAFFDTSMIAMIGIGILFAVNYMRLKEKTIEDEAKLLTYELYADSYEKLIGEIRSRQHDFIHHISAIENMHYVYQEYDSLVSH